MTKLRIAFVVAAITAASLAPGCATVPKELRSKWCAAGSHGTHSWFKNWRIGSSEYSMDDGKNWTTVMRMHAKRFKPIAIPGAETKNPR